MWFLQVSSLTLSSARFSPYHSMLLLSVPKAFSGCSEAGASICVMVFMPCYLMLYPSSASNCFLARTSTFQGREAPPWPHGLSTSALCPLVLTSSFSNVSWCCCSRQKPNCTQDLWTVSKYYAIVITSCTKYLMCFRSLSKVLWWQPGSAIIRWCFCCC